MSESKSIQITLLTSQIIPKIDTSALLALDLSTIPDPYSYLEDVSNAELLDLFTRFEKILKRCVLAPADTHPDFWKANVFRQSIGDKKLFIFEASGDSSSWYYLVDPIATILAKHPTIWDISILKPEIVKL